MVHDRAGLDALGEDDGLIAQELLPGDEYSVDVFANTVGDVIAAVPRTLSGKKLELPVKKLLMGQSLEKVVNRDAMVNPESMDWFVSLAERRMAGAEAMTRSGA